MYKRTDDTGNGQDQKKESEETVPEKIYDRKDNPGPDKRGQKKGLETRE